MLNHVEAMLSAQPRSQTINARDLQTCLQACHNCAYTCTACADACLNEKDVHNLAHCIRLNLDCADICAVTARLLARQASGTGDLLRRQLEACIAACRACGDECEKHAHHHQHCQVCLEACRQCEKACQALLVAVPA